MKYFFYLHWLWLWCIHNLTLYIESLFFVRRFHGIPIIFITSIIMICIEDALEANIDMKIFDIKIRHMARRRYYQLANWKMSINHYWNIICDWMTANREVVRNFRCNRIANTGIWARVIRILKTVSVVSYYGWQSMLFCGHSPNFLVSKRLWCL